MVGRIVAPADDPPGHEITPDESSAMLPGFRRRTCVPGRAWGGKIDRPDVPSRTP